MRATKLIRAVVGTCLGAMVITGVGAATAPLQAQGDAQVCMFYVSSCSGSECALTCFYFDQRTTAVCNPTNFCCNCFL